MVRPFGGTNLFELYMNKFEYLSNINNPFSHVAMAIGKSDKRLWEIASHYPVEIIERSDYSINASITDDCEKVYHYLKDFDEEYVMWVNGCFPFLQPDTIIKAAEFFKAYDLKGLHCVKKVYNWIWNPKTGILINKENARKMSTVHFEPYYESVHCFHIYRRKQLLKHNCYWKFKKDDPYLYEVKDGIEFMDIDIEPEFDRCEYIYVMENE